LAVYGLPELNRQAIRNAQLTANPGCYATASTLALLPFLSHGLIETEGISIAAYSGLTGAGRQYVSSNSNLFVDIDGNLRAYAVGKHKHTPEIEQTCSIAAGKAVQVSFIPHLAPLDRGILATVFARAKSELSAAKAYEALHSFYSSERAPFVRVLQNSANVAVANVRNNNYCDLAAFLDPRTGMLVVHSAIDNLVKGAAGQAVQNMNLMMGFPEDLGLRGRSI
jgi:N-acetyl-gamma-glutamyl-phosphate reductase